MTTQKRLAQQTEMSAWERMTYSTEADCETCLWNSHDGTDRTVEYAARRHVVETGHDVELTRVRTCTVSRVAEPEEPMS